MEKLYQNREWLYQKYWNEELNEREISIICGVSRTSINYWLHKLGIQVRSLSEAKMGKKNPMYKKRPWNKELSCPAETREKISKSNKGHVPWDIGLKAEDDIRIKRFVEAGHKARIGSIPWNKDLPSHLQSMYGKHHSKKTKKKMSNSQKGKKRNPEIRKKISESHKGQIAWNEGLTKETDLRLAKISKARKGQISWIKGLTMESDERVKKISDSNKGHIVTELTRKKLSIANKGQIPWILGLTMETDERVKKLSEKSKERMQNPDFQKRFQKAMHAKPNNLEQYFNQITSNRIQYVGDYRFWIKTNQHSRNPDFVILKKAIIDKWPRIKKIIIDLRHPERLFEPLCIELWGSHPYHKDDVKEEMIGEYAKVGWGCIVFWDYEVYEEPERVLKEVNNFIKEHIGTTRI